MKSETQNRLIQYGIMAGAVVITQKLNAQVIYTDIEPDILLYQYVNEDEGWGYVDLDMNDTIDIGIKFEVGYNCGYCPYWVDFQVNAAIPNELMVATAGPCTLSTAYSDNTCYVEGRNLTDFLIEGEEVNPNALFMQAAPELYDFQCGDYGEGCSQGFFHGDYGPIDDQFLAIRMIKEDTNYCWLRLRWEGDALYIKDYACNLNPNEGLIIEIPEVGVTVNEDDTYCNIFASAETISINGNVTPENGMLLIYDVIGNLILQAPWISQNQQFHFNLPTGIYFAQLVSGNVSIAKQLYLN